MIGVMYRHFSYIFLFFFFIVTAGLFSQESTSEKNKVSEKDKKTQVELTADSKENQKPEEKSDFQKLLEKELKSEANQASDVKEQTSWLWQFIKTLLVLGGMILFFYIVWRVYNFKRNLPGRGSGVFQVWHEFSLVPGKTLQIVEMANRLLILAVSDSGVQLVTELTEKSIIDRVKLDCEKNNQSNPPDFLLELSKSVRGKVEALFNPEKKILETEKKQNSENTWENTRKESIDKLKKLKNEKELLRQENEI
ncbi:MAG: flagellar biosynthetic protein FliO [Spirochaetia bacterium]|nr:flagellar biosynthetic protein FliO [Spirochaetia bacterium]